MTWHPDTPDLPISKPKEVARLEQMDPTFLNSMPSGEIDKLVVDTAAAVAKTYHKEVQTANYDECLEIVSVALSVTGSDIGGRVGLALVAASELAAQQACSPIFPNSERNFN